VTGWTTRQAAEKCGLTQHGRGRFCAGDLDGLVLLSRLRATSTYLH
jgi:hypothetical protein